MSEKPHSGRVAVVTGARRGIGKSIALALGRDGARIVIVDNEPAVEAERELQAAGIDAFALGADVTDERVVAALADTVRQRCGAVNIVVNAAGIAMRKRTIDTSVEDWHRVIDVNLTGPFLVVRALLPLMEGQKFGRIVHMTSVMAHIATGDRAAYCASKAGLLALTRVQALDLAAQGFTVNAISPGAVATDMTAALRNDPEKNAHLMAITPLKRWCEAGEIAAVARFLCSDDAGYITGTDIVIDGGWLAQ